jgi:hypothetical protein
VSDAWTGLVFTWMAEATGPPRGSCALLHGVPFPLLAHQAPILPLKAWRPALFNGTALVVGSMAPDLQNFWNTPTGAAEFGHTLVGQLVFCLPMTMFVVLFVGNLRLGEVLAARLGGRFAWLADAATDIARPGGMLRAVTSALIGSFSHLGLDALTHETVPGWMPHRLYRIDHLVFSAHAITQAVASVIGALLAVWMLRRISLQNTRKPPTPRPGALWLLPFALAGAAFGLLRSLPAIRWPDGYFENGRVYVWGYAVFLVTVGASAGVLAAATLLAWWDHRSQAPAPIQYFSAR